MFARFKLNSELTYILMSGAMTLFDSTMFVYMTVYFFTVVGLNPFQLVLVGTVLEGSILLFELPTGLIADIYSRRLSVILGVMVLGFAFVIVALARSFPEVILSQVIAGLGYTFLSGATDAWLADEVGDERVGAIYLRSGQINRLLGILGITISALLASIRLDLPILIGGLLYLILALFLAVTMPENHFKPFRHESNRGGLPAMVAAFREGTRIIRARPALVSLVLINFFVGASSEGFDRLGDAHLVANFTFPILEVPMLGTLNPVVWFSILSLVGSVLSLLVIERSRRYLERLTKDLNRTAQVLIGLTVIFSVCGIGFGLAGSFPLAVGCLLLRWLVGSMIWPLFNAYQVQSVPSRLRATVLSMTGQSNALGQVLGGPMVGWIGTASLRVALVVAGLLILPNSLLYRKREAGGNQVEEPQIVDNGLNPENE